jgi:predicted anti-sigma-YlaC factor YlaD
MELVQGEPGNLCTVSREQLSARLDGEWAGPTTAADAHVQFCSSCSAWSQEAHVLARATRLGTTTDVPDLSREIALSLSSLNIEVNGRRRTSPLPMLRVALAVVSVAVMIGALASIMHTPDAFGAGHLPRELGGFEFALGFGFLLTAARPRHATGIATIGSVAAVMMVGTAVADVVSGVTTSGFEAHHVLDLAGAALAVGVARLANHREFDTLKRTMGVATVLG